MRVSLPPYESSLLIHELNLLSNLSSMTFQSEPGRPCSQFQIEIHDCARSFFSMAVESIVGDGANTLFWKDRRLHRQRIEDIILLLFAAVCCPYQESEQVHFVLQAVTEQSWIREIQGAISVGGPR